MSEPSVWLLSDESQMVRFGRLLGQAARPDATLFLRGNLGMGKTTLSRGVIESFGHQGAVKSPTYTLVEPYRFEQGLVYHFDLYRLADPEELEYLGIRDYFSEQALRLIEWPDRGQGILPQADIELIIDKSGTGRKITVKVNNDKGRQVLTRLTELEADQGD